MSLEQFRNDYTRIHGSDPFTGQKMPSDSYFKSDAQLNSLRVYGADHITGQKSGNNQDSNKNIGGGTVAGGLIAGVIGFLPLILIINSENIEEFYNSVVDFFSFQTSSQGEPITNRTPPEINVVTRDGSFPLLGTPARVEQPLSSPVVSCITAQSGVNVRLNPMIRDGNIISSAPFNTAVIHTGIVANVNWQRVEANGAQGWIHTDYLRPAVNGRCPR